MLDVFAKIVQPANVPLRRKQQVPVVVRVSVQERNCVLAALDNQPPSIITLGHRLTKEAGRIGAGQQFGRIARLRNALVADNVAQTPRRPKLFV
jgi:hypothetical protein